MNIKKYIVDGLGEFFDGLVVEGAVFVSEGHELLLVERIEQPSELFETFSVPVYGGLTIEMRVLKDWKPAGELQTDNPYGLFKSEGSFSRDGVSVYWATYARAMTVNVKNENKTLFSANFFDGKARHELIMFLQEAVVDTYEITEICFDLQDMQYE